MGISIKDCNMIPWNEWYEFSVSDRPSVVLQSFKDTGRLSGYPNLVSMINTPQNPKSHPEGDVWNHTKQVIDWAAKLARKYNYTEDAICIEVMSALLHDIGKADVWTDGRPVTFIENGVPHAPKHALRGEQLTPDVMSRMNAPYSIIPIVSRLVGDHMYHMKYMDGNPPSANDLYEFIKPYNDMGIPLKSLLILVISDNNGRTGINGERAYRYGLPDGVITLINNLKDYHLI